jgi:hemolysin activation/secretion protein
MVTIEEAIKTGREAVNKFNEDEEREYKDSIDLSIDVIMLPLALKIISDNQRFQFSGGFELAIPTRLTADNGAQEIDVSDQVNKLGVNMIFGIGYRVPVQRSFLVFNLGYSQGLSNLANNMDAEDSYLPRIRLTAFRLSASWLLPVGQAKTN